MGDMPTITDTQACKFCNRTEGQHNGNCPEVLKTHEQRVSYAAHVWNEHYGYSSVFPRLLGMGFLKSEIEEGIALNRKQEEERRGWIAQYGSPEYGGWTQSKRDGRRKPYQVVEKEIAEDAMVESEL